MLWYNEAFMGGGGEYKIKMIINRNIQNSFAGEYYRLL